MKVNELKTYRENGSKVSWYLGKEGLITVIIFGLATSSFTWVSPLASVGRHRFLFLR